MTIESDIILWGLERPGWQQGVLVALANGDEHGAEAIACLVDEILAGSNSAPSQEAKSIQVKDRRSPRDRPARLQTTSVLEFRSLGARVVENIDEPYEIDWQPHTIRWLVDGEVVYERMTWNPTPIPDQPLQFNVNLWHSRSKEFAGPLASAHLPASAGIRSVEICSTVQETTEELRDSLPMSPAGCAQLTGAS